MEAPGPRLKLRQPWLFPASGSLAERLGAEMFARLPESPGVYRFFGDGDRLLYIGQSSNLRARVGSYRYVTAESHPRRIVRMVARARRVEWELCASPAAAIALESRQLLEHAPPFNRAGVWSPPPWWLSLSENNGRLHAHLTRTLPEDSPGSIGPLPSAFRYTFAALMRCVWRCHWPETLWWNLPHGMAGAVIPLEQTIPLGGNSAPRAGALANFITTGCVEVLDSLTAHLSGLDPESPGGMFWTADGDELRKFAARAAGAGETA